MVHVGDWVQLKALPPDVDMLPLESQAVFQYCLGRRYRVVEVDTQGLFVLDVSADIDPLFGGYMNDIRVEEACLQILPSDKADEGRHP